MTRHYKFIRFMNKILFCSFGLHEPKTLEDGSSRRILNPEMTLVMCICAFCDKPFRKKIRR